MPRKVSRAIIEKNDSVPVVFFCRDSASQENATSGGMQVDLRRREQQQEMSRQQRFHQEKMAAVGSLAAAIGHEVSNPLAAISGAAQVMIDETKDDNRKISKGNADQMNFERVAMTVRKLRVIPAFFCSAFGRLRSFPVVFVGYVSFFV